MRQLRLLAAWLLLAGTAAAQTTSSSMSGTVLDDTSQVVPGATVTIVNEGTGADPGSGHQRSRRVRVRGPDAGTLHHQSRR